MLGRSANGIFWMCRYLERAENTARLLDAGFRLALTSGQAAASDEWWSVLVTIGQDTAYREVHGETGGIQVANFILRDRENPASVLNMIEHARTNARAVRTSLTREVWEATNETWMVLREALSRPVRAATMLEALSLIRRQSALVRGAMEGTMLRNEVFNFARIGTHIERADNTARILDVKYYVLLPSVSLVGSTLDNVQWENVLRSLAGERAYRWLNAGRMDPRGISAFLILDSRFPRSLVYSYEKMRSNMAGLAREYGHESHASELLRNVTSGLHATTIDDIFELGLHQFITGSIAQIREIADAIASEYRFYA